MNVVEEIVGGGVRHNGEFMLSINDTILHCWSMALHCVEWYVCEEEREAR